MKVTTNDIAKAAGVSQATVSIVLNNNTKISISPETRALVLKTAEELGYKFKKRGKAVDQSSVVGLLIPTLSNLYYPFLAQNVEAYAKTLGLTVVMQNTKRSEAGELQSFNYLRSIGVKGIISLFSPKAPIPEDIPMVIVGEKLAGVEVDTVKLNSFVSGQVAAEHLISLGHREIAFVSTPFTNMTDARNNRREGILSKMKEAGLSEGLRVFVDDQEENDNLDSTYEFDCGVRQTERLLREYPRCTAIIAVNDMTAMGCISVLNRHGIRIPDQMAICGFDNLYLDKMISPQLTSVDQMAFHGCKVGLGVLMEKMKSHSPQEEAVCLEYMPKLYARGSTVKE